MKVSSDFLRADVNFVMVEMETDHHYNPQHHFEDSKKMVIHDLPTGLYRVMVYMQNVQYGTASIFDHVTFSFNFRLFSFHDRDTTFLQAVHFDQHGELIPEEHMDDPVEVVMAFSTPEKMECFAQGRRLPDNLTQDVLLHETDFSYSFSIFGEDLAFINQHVIRYQPEEGEDLLRIQVDHGIKVYLFHAQDYDHDSDSAHPIALSHDRLGNNLHELVAEHLSDRDEYVIEVVFAEDPEDFMEKQMIECLIAEMQIKIASSYTDFACLKGEKSSLQRQIDSQTTPVLLSYKNLNDKGKHVLMVPTINTGGQLKAPKVELDIKDDDTELEVTIEGSDHFYGSIIQIIREGDDKDIYHHN